MIKVNGEVFADKEFPNGEIVYMKPIIDESSNVITIVVESSKDISNLAIANKYLEDVASNVEKVLIIESILFKTVDLKCFTDILNQMGFNKVIVQEISSTIKLDSIKNLEVGGNL